MIIDTNNLNKAREMLKKADNPKVVLAQDDEFNRKILEKAEFDILLSPERQAKKTTVKNIDSGLNHVLCRIAGKKGIAIGINLDEIRKESKKDKGNKLEKIIQNIRLCRKFKVRLAIKGAKDKIDSKSFLMSLGASSSQASQALSF